MKNASYKLITNVSAFLIGLNAAIGNGIIGLIGGVFNSVSIAMGIAASSLLRKIDDKRYQHSKLMFEQYAELNELELLINITKVRDDAIRQRSWTMGHTISINRLGTALHVQCGWPPERVHGYLKPVIEKIPGMIYQGGEYAE